MPALARDRKESGYRPDASRTRVYMHLAVSLVDGAGYWLVYWCIDRRRRVDEVKSSMSMLRRYKQMAGGGGQRVDVLM